MLNSNLSLETASTSKTATVNANTGYTFLFDIDTTRKRILALRGVDASNGNVVVSSAVITGDKTVRVDVLNTYSSGITVSVSVFVLVGDI